MAKKAYNQGKPPCYLTHPDVIFEGVPGILFGGNCSTPNILNADVYVALESMCTRNDRRSYPWTGGHSFTFPIPNMGVAEKPDDFKRLVAWIAEQLIAEKLVHVGCIGGHGRTGMVLAAVASVLGHGKEATSWIRENYCFKAVESPKQVAFLDAEFGIEPVVPYYEIKKAAQK